MQKKKKKSEVEKNNGYSVAHKHNVKVGIANSRCKTLHTLNKSKRNVLTHRVIVHNFTALQEDSPMPTRAMRCPT